MDAKLSAANVSCPSCGAAAALDSKFCRSCGSALSVSVARDPYLGNVISRKYRVEELIGEGGMGKVYRANQLSLDKPVVVKVLHRSLLADAGTVARFEREARAASRLHHPNSITVLDFGRTEDGSQYIAMELVGGKDLYQLLTTQWPLPEARLARIMAQVLSALADAHAAGVIHRDLKPENIMVEERRRDGDLVKVLDFGIAKIQEAAGEEGAPLTRTGFVCGTPEYMSPEQARGAVLDARSDLYTVGVILYQLTTGVLPFTAASPVALATKHLTEKPVPPRERRPDAKISPPMEQLILRALSKSPADRPQTALAFRAQLLAIERGEEMREWGLPPRDPRSAIERQKTRKKPGRPGSFSGPGTVFFKFITLMLLAASMGLMGYWFYLSRGVGPDVWVPPANAPMPGDKLDGR